MEILKIVLVLIGKLKKKIKSVLIKFIVYKF